MQTQRSDTNIRDGIRAHIRTIEKHDKQRINNRHTVDIHGSTILVVRSSSALEYIKHTAVAAVLAILP